MSIIVCVLCLAGVAFAQWTDNMGGSWNNPTSASIGNIINDQLWNRIRAKARARAKTGNSVLPTSETLLLYDKKLGFDEIEIPTINGVLDGRKIVHGVNLPLSSVDDGGKFDSGDIKIKPVLGTRSSPINLETEETAIIYVHYNLKKVPRN